MYRSLEHGITRKRCRHRDIAGFPLEIRNFAAVFVEMQDKRHEADYTPDAEFSKADVIRYVNQAENAIAAFLSATLVHRRAFAVHVLFDHNR